MKPNFFLAVLLLLPRSAIPAEGPALDWAQAVSEVSRANPELQAATETWIASQFNSRASHSGFFPQLSAGLGLSRTNSDSGTGDPTSSRTRTNYTANLNLSQNIFRGFADSATMGVAKARQEIAAADLEITRARISFDLKSAFAGLTYAQSSIRLSQEIVKRQSDNLRLVELRFQGGRENKGSFLLSKATLGLAQYERSQAEQNLITLRQELARVLGRDTADELSITGSVPVTRPPPSVPFETVATATPEYRQSIAQTTLAEHQITQARSGFFPTLDLTGSAGKSDDQFFPQRDRWSAGVSLTLPFFNGGRDYYATKSASRTLAAATLLQSNRGRSVLASLRDAFSAYVLSVQKLEVDLDFAEAAQLRAEITRNRYNNGLISFEDWILIENDLISRQRTALQSQRARVIAESSWERAQGKGVFNP
jgi:outer membrane protein